MNNKKITQMVSFAGLIIVESNVITEVDIEKHNNFKVLKKPWIKLVNLYIDELISNVSPTSCVPENVDFFLPL